MEVTIMLDSRIRFEERYDNREYNSTTLYFIAPKDIFPIDCPEAVEMEISLEFPKGCGDPAYTSVALSPINEHGECYDWYDIDLPCGDIGALIALAYSSGGGDMKVERFDVVKYPKTYAYVMENDTVNRRCNRCGSVVMRETNIVGYPYQCMACDENMYEIETHIGEPHTEEELDELLINTLILGLDD